MKLFSIMLIGIMMSAFIYNDEKQNASTKTYTNLKEALANADSVFILSISGEDMKVIPKEVFKLKNLRKLWLNDNNLTSIDKEIANLQYLEELVLFNNHLKDLPIEFKNLKRLKKLDLYGNHFTAIPNAICGLDSLQILRMLGSRIKTYPDCIFGLKKLERLYIQNWNGKYEIDSVQLMKLREGLPNTHIDDLKPYAVINFNR